MHREECTSEMALVSTAGSLSGAELAHVRESSEYESRIERRVRRGPHRGREREREEGKNEHRGNNGEYIMFAFTPIDPLYEVLIRRKLLLLLRLLRHNLIDAVVILHEEIETLYPVSLTSQ